MTLTLTVSRDYQKKTGWSEPCPFTPLVSSPAFQTSPPPALERRNPCDVTRIDPDLHVQIALCRTVRHCGPLRRAGDAGTGHKHRGSTLSTIAACRVELSCGRGAT